MRYLPETSIKVILTPFRAPNANAYAERWVRSVREECVDHVLILNERHLHHVLREYSRYYNRARHHQGLGQQIPESASSQLGKGPVQRRDILTRTAPRLLSRCGVTACRAWDGVFA